MVTNNIETDIKVKCVEEQMTQAKRDEGVVNNTFVKMLEALGYDIELHYVKREG